MNLAMDFFFKNLTPNPRVLEIGTRRWTPGKPTHHQGLFPSALQYVKTDFMDGEDVDQVSDIHKLSSSFEEFDAVWASSVFEHLHAPWIAAEEIVKALKPKGVFFVQTHLVFPEHGYPQDFFRFTTMGLEALFKPFTPQVVTCYEYPCTITPADKSIPWNPVAPAFLNVCISGVKP